MRGGKRALWNWGAILLRGAKYADVMERALCNGIISGVDLGGGGFTRIRLCGSMAMP